MSYKTLFCLGVTTLLAASAVPALAVQSSSIESRANFFYIDLVLTNQDHLLQKHKTIDTVALATADTKGESPSSRPMREGASK